MSPILIVFIGLIFIAIGVYAGIEVTNRQGGDKYLRSTNVRVYSGIGGAVWVLIYLLLSYIGVITD